MKAMTLSPASSRNSTVGEIVNLMSVDVQKCQDVCHFINFMWSSPVIIVIAIYFLWQILGPSTLAGVIFMLVILPINSVLLAKKIRDVQVSLQLSGVFIIRICGVVIIFILKFSSYISPILAK